MATHQKLEVQSMTLREFINLYQKTPGKVQATVKSGKKTKMKNTERRNAKTRITKIIKIPLPPEKHVCVQPSVDALYKPDVRRDPKEFSGETLCP